MLRKKVTSSCYFLIKMFACVVGVACGAQRFLYFTSKMKLSRYFESWVARRGKKFEHCCAKTMKIVNNVKRHQKPKFVQWFSCCFWCKDTKQKPPYMLYIWGRAGLYVRPVSWGHKLGFWCIICFYNMRLQYASMICIYNMRLQYASTICVYHMRL